MDVDCLVVAPGDDKKCLRFLLQKELRNSDVGSLGRIVLPKTGAEAHLPVLTSREGILISMDDMDTLQIIQAKKTAHHEVPSPSSKNSLLSAKTAGDHLVPDMEGSRSMYFHVNLPVTDEMCMEFLNDAFSSEFPLDLLSEKIHPSTSFGPVENLSLDDFP
ncbi:B3 domain-containing transcription factor [Asimina triloba]